MADTSPNSDTLCALLRQFVARKTPQQALEYVAELLLDVADDSANEDASALARMLEETLNDADALALSSEQVQELVQELMTLLRPSAVSKDDEKAERRAAHIAALRVQYAAGKRCLAVLEEDSEWHPAVIVQHIDGDITSDAAGSTRPKQQQRKKMTRTVRFYIEIEFVEFGKKVVVQMADVVLDEDRADKDDDDDMTGLCAMCERPMNLTAHHLIPRTTHSRYLKQGYTKEFLNTCVMICRQCHSKIHSTEDERTLAREYNTLDKIMTHPEIVRWVSYASKQKARIKPVKKSKYPVGK